MATHADSRALDPDRRPLTGMQAQRLAALTDLPAKELASKTILELSEKLKWRIEPELFWFRKVCGRVVKRDPATGVEYPVPFATVHVEDTDCSFLGYFPAESPFSWFFPFKCKREVIGTAKTDACGRFCVYVPRFEIDWILRFRLKRVCFPTIFLRPTVRELLEELLEPPIVVRPPLPDPPPILKGGGGAFRLVQEALGPSVASMLAGFEAGAAFGQSTGERDRLLDSRAFTESLRPPLPAEFRSLKIDAERKRDRLQAAMEPARASLATRLRLDPELVASLNFERFVGPFRRCHHVVVPEWVPMFDVPDVTFRVTQDVNGDGTEETIYSEGYFDVRWNAGTIPDVTLEASPIAVAGHVCETPSIPCANTPAILFAGLHPLLDNDPVADPYFDADTGYAIRVNRPHPSGLLSDPLPNPPATAPMARVLQLYGCNRIPGAAQYRLRYSFNGGPSVPFTGMPPWPLYRVVAGSLQTSWPASDSNGWYPVLPATDNWYPDLLLLEWNTSTFQNGLYRLELDVRDGGGTVTTSDPVSIRVDNDAPLCQFTRLRWRKAGTAAWTELPRICPVINRGVVPSDIQIEVSFTVAASHLRSVQLSAGGCGGGNPVLSSALDTAQHWHTGALDNSFTSVAVFDLAAVPANPPGAYGFSLYAASRAFNPSGGDGGHLADWNYDPAPIYAIPHLPVAIVNA